MFSKQSKQAMSSSFSTFSNDFRNLACLEAEEQGAPAAESVSKIFVEPFHLCMSRVQMVVESTTGTMLCVSRLKSV